MKGDVSTWYIGNGNTLSRPVEIKLLITVHFISAEILSGKY